MGDTHESGGASPEALTPSSALTFAEAAVLAGVDPARIEALAEGGELLFEGSRTKRRDGRIVRLIDLADVFPHVLGRRPAAEVRPDPAPEATPVEDPEPAPAQAPASGPAQATPEVELRQLDVPRADLAEEVMASGASREALVELASDLETRLDLAERERQASTASLLMAQRRVLDLEQQLRRRPWSRAAAVAATALSIGALIAVVRVPGMVRAAAADEIDRTSAAAEQQLEALRVAASEALEEASASRAAEVERVERALTAAVTSAEESARAVRDGRLAAEERVAAVEARAGAEREELRAALGGLEERLRIADERDRRRTTELEVARDAASRERLRFEERLGEARRGADAAREALLEAQRAGADERAAHARTMAALTERLEASSAALERLEKAADRVETPPPAAGPEREAATPVQRANPDTGRELSWGRRLMELVFGSGS